MGNLIKTLITGLLGGTMVSLPTIVKRVLISLGFGVAVFTGMSVLLSSIQTQAFNNLQGVPSIALQIFGILNIDVAFNIVISAFSIKLTMRSMGGVNPKQMGLF